MSNEPEAVDVEVFRAYQGLIKELGASIEEACPKFAYETLVNGLFIRHEDFDEQERDKNWLASVVIQDGEFQVYLEDKKELELHEHKFNMGDPNFHESIGKIVIEFLKAE